MIDPVELKATHDSATPTEILDAAREIAPKPYEKRTLGDSLWVGAFARQVLALSDEVERKRIEVARFREVTHDMVELCGWLTAISPKGHEKKIQVLATAKSLLGGVSIVNRRAEAAESEAQALRERMGEIREKYAVAARFIESLGQPAYAKSMREYLDRIAALSTTPKEKEG